MGDEMEDQTRTSNESVGRDEWLLLSEDATYKRSILLDRARRGDSLRRDLQVLSGAMALLSGLIATAVFAEIFGSLWIKVV